MVHFQQIVMKFNTLDVGFHYNLLKMFHCILKNNNFQIFNIFPLAVHAQDMELKFGLMTHDKAASQTTRPIAPCSASN